MKALNHRVLWLLAAAAVVFYSPGLLPGKILLPLDVLCWQLPWSATSTCAGVQPKNPVLSDFVLQQEPWRAVIRRDGWRAALWNPYASAGSPMLANGQSQPLYPPNWLLLLLPPSWGYVLWAILKTIIATGFTFAFARKRHSEPAAALAAVTFGFSYVFVFWLGYPGGEALVWLPALLWALSPVRPVWLAIFSALDLLAGQPEMSVVVAAIAAVVLFTTAERTVKSMLKAVAAACVGLVIALPQIVPLLQYAKLSAAGRFRAEYNPEFFSAHVLFELITPQFFGTSSPNQSWGSIAGGYFGLLALVLVVSWWTTNPKRAAANPFTWILVVSLLIVYRIPPFSWLMELPHLRTIYVSKFWVAVTFSGAMLAAAALDDHVGRRRLRIEWTIALTVACSVLTFALFRDYIVQLGLQRFETWVAVKIAIVLLVSFAVLRWRPSWAALAAFAELSMYLFGYNPATSRDLFYPVTPAIQFLQKDVSKFRIMGDGVLPGNTASVFGLEDVRGYDALTYMPYFEYMTRIDPSFPDLVARLDLAVAKSRPLTRGTLFERDRFFRPLEKWGEGYRNFLHRAYYWNEQLTTVRNPRLLDLLNVKYYLVGHGAHPPPGLDDYKLVFSGEVDVYQNPHVLPRVHVDGVGWRAGLVRYLPTEVEVQASGPGLLVLADTCYPGWVAEGYTIEPVEGLLCGVRIGPGPQRVRFHFR